MKFPFSMKNPIRSDRITSIRILEENLFDLGKIKKEYLPIEDNESLFD